MKLVLFVGIVQHAVEGKLIDLGHGADVTGYSRLDLVVILALNLEQVADLEGFSALADKELTVFGDGSLVNPEDRQLADKGIDGDLKNMRKHVLGRIGLDDDTLAALIGTAHERRRISFGRIRHQPGDDLQQLRNARAILAGSETDGHQVSLAKSLLEGIVQLLRF